MQNVTEGVVATQEDRLEVREGDSTGTSSRIDDRRMKAKRPSKGSKGQRKPSNSTKDQRKPDKGTKGPKERKPKRKPGLHINLNLSLDNLKAKLKSRLKPKPKSKDKKKPKPKHPKPYRKRIMCDCKSSLGDLLGFLPLAVLVGYSTSVSTAAAASSASGGAAGSVTVTINDADTTTIANTNSPTLTNTDNDVITTAANANPVNTNTNTLTNNDNDVITNTNTATNNGRSAAAPGRRTGLWCRVVESAIWSSDKHLILYEEGRFHAPVTSKTSCLSTIAQFSDECSLLSSVFD